eukprot:CAMPEP_0194716380 /NCGR_PEP_ID=MMETSP0296-20130528/8100_1 /TAXON_ID=39354 /ORGANISM="Heterosigma akashiwo, Strain CCMP2393" /LENGTH=61 /DNA_ID=CAMNT_0039616745 /DNA_START=449 /DNA_END=634 /DNA_ORIENTATION=-
MLQPHAGAEDHAGGPLLRRPALEPAGERVGQAPLAPPPVGEVRQVVRREEHQLLAPVDLAQ